MFQKWGPLQTSTKNNPSEVIPILIHNGADPNYRNNDGNTALMFAIQKDYAHALMPLIKLGVDLTIKNAQNKSAMDLALEKGNSIVIQQLREASK